MIGAGSTIQKYSYNYVLGVLTSLSIPSDEPSHGHAGPCRGHLGLCPTYQGFW